tara:strand:- start:1507 stop:1821 length:315 start_codon:yes stop_codon:yes gene_type:complete
MLKKRAPRLETPTSDRQKAAARKKTVSAKAHTGSSGKSKLNKAIRADHATVFSKSKDSQFWREYSKTTNELETLQKKVAASAKHLSTLKNNLSKANTAAKKAKK